MRRCNRQIQSTNHTMLLSGIFSSTSFFAGHNVGRFEFTHQPPPMLVVAALAVGVVAVGAPDVHCDCVTGDCILPLLDQGPLPAAAESGCVASHIQPVRCLKQVSWPLSLHVHALPLRFYAALLRNVTYVREASSNRACCTAACCRIKLELTYKRNDVRLHGQFPGAFCG